ncbi:MAG: gliding motility protein GldL [Chitinophagaceae bacterium]|jgi:gliding motility-associated protein GldL|nr:gliding motility protein GldL [Chitinophagaceae bacterium]MCU0404259.1 gliding motility protein GldL [Chitinophagaceae bacterium]
MAAVSRRTEIIVNVIVCVGATIVLIGAWSKLLHLPFADTMLTVGLLTEAFIFLVYAFLPPASSGPVAAPAATGGNPALKSLDKMLQEAEINPTNLQKLSAGFQKLGTTVDKMGEVSDVIKSTGDFSNATKNAANAMSSITTSVEKTSETMLKFNQVGEVAGQFHGQVQNLTKNLSSLNAIYELELQDTNNHLKAMNSFFGNLTAISQSMQGSVGDAQKAQEQISLLAKNLGSLNNVYGNMLSAMQVRN